MRDGGVSENASCRGNEEIPISAARTIVARGNLAQYLYFLRLVLQTYSIEDTVTIHLKEIAVHTRNWMDSTQDRDYWIVLLNAALDFWVS